MFMQARRITLSLLAALILCAPIVACTVAEESAVDAAAPAPDSASAGRLDDYRLGPGDKIAVRVFGQQDVSGEFEVGPSGKLAMPLLGQIDAARKTLNELQAELVTGLQAYMVKPKVTLQITSYRPFYILGQVNKPGSYPFQAGINVRMAVALAGGFTRRARETPVFIYRYDAEGQEKRLRVSADAPVLPGDSIDVPRRLF